MELSLGMNVGKLSFQETGIWERRVEHMIPWGMEWTYEEGKRLSEEGAVLAMERKRNGDVVALVEDEGIHTVCLSFLPPPLFLGRRKYLPSFLGDLSYLCSCGEEGIICPHVVAVLLSLGKSEVLQKVM